MNLSRLRWLSLIIALIVGACSTAPHSPATGGSIRAEAIMQDIAALSSDEMMGRATGTEGERRAAAYLESRLRQIGLEPVAGSYRQQVQLVGTRRNPGSELAIAGPDGPLPLHDGDNVAFWSSTQQPEVTIQSAPLVFVGYGVQAPEYDWDDFKGADVAGKVLLFLNDDPPVTEQGVELFGGPARTYYGRWTYKFEQAMRLGAAGALMIHTTPSASYPFSVVSGSGQREHFALDLEGTGYQVPLLGWLDESLSNDIAHVLGTDLDGLFEMAGSREFQPVDTGYRVHAHILTAVRKITTENVLALLPGSDPRLREQTVVFSAHYDHLGVSPELEGDDKIFNGAWDNASGTASILALAQAFAAAPTAPRRSLLFLACAAEEAGSLGSQWFVAKPPIERARLVADFNIDMPQIFGLTSDLAVIGADTNTLGDALQRAAADFPVTVDGVEQPVRITGDPDPGAGIFYRSDQVNFAKAGIPAVFINPGVDYVEPLGFDPREYEQAHYHQPSDEIGPEWNLIGLVRDLRLVLEAAAIVADAEEMPHWNPGNEFEQAWRHLHELS